MPANENLVNRLRQFLSHLPWVEEKMMFNFHVFMVDGKLCLGVRRHEMMVRIDPTMVETVIERNGCRQMMHGKIIMKGYLLIEEEALQRYEDFSFWVNLALDFNPIAKKAKGK
jgi:hypothetical protein